MPIMANRITSALGLAFRLVVECANIALALGPSLGSRSQPPAATHNPVAALLDRDMIPMVTTFSALISQGQKTGRAIFQRDAFFERRQLFG